MKRTWVRSKRRDRYELRGSLHHGCSCGSHWTGARAWEALEAELYLLLREEFGPEEVSFWSPSG